jgi:hypothetical protein
MSSSTDGPKSAKQAVGQDQFSEDGQAALSFGSGFPRVLALVTPREEEWRLHSVKTALMGPEMPFRALEVWAEDNPLGLAINIPPVVIEIRLRVTPVKMRQHPIQTREEKGYLITSRDF